MSTQIKPLIVGLASPGLFWLATSVAFGQDAPAPQGPPTSAPTSPATYRALLLSTGTVVRGEIIDVPAAKAYCLKGSGGPVPYPKSRVLKAAGSVEELYQFQVDRLPSGDPDERIKLAKWCLTEKMLPQAKEQLEAVKAMCPNDAQVDRMLYNLAASGSEKPAIDPELRRTSAEAPSSLDPRVVKTVKKYHGLPQVFDLPPAQAVKRANEFAQYIQPVLQQNCVKCHNEKYTGNFQLVEARIRRDQTNVDILRANLDATLNLVNQNDPSRSELLTAGLVPHGGNRSAIFKGPNDQGYVALVTWIKRVCPPATGPAEVAGRSGFKSEEPAGGDGFATDRSSRPGGSSSFPVAGNGSSSGAGSTGTGMQIPQSGRTINTYNESAEFVRNPEDNPQFPAPFSFGGAPVTPMTPTKPKSKPGPANGPATPPADPSAPPNLSTQTAKQIGPNAVSVGPTDTLKQLPGMDKPLYPTPPSKDDDADPDMPKPPPKKKTKKIDPATLEQLLKNRNGGATPTGP